MGTREKALIGVRGTLVLANERVLPVDLLPRHQPGAPERREPLLIDEGVLEQGLVARRLPLDLGQLHLEWPGVDLGQELPLVHQVPFSEEHPEQLPCNPTAHRHRVAWHQRSEAGQRYPNVGRPGRRRLDRNRAVGGHLPAAPRHERLAGTLRRGAPIGGPMADDGARGSNQDGCETDDVSSRHDKSHFRAGPS